MLSLLLVLVLDFLRTANELELSKCANIAGAAATAGSTADTIEFA